jgi:hypothetical protein
MPSNAITQMAANNENLFFSYHAFGNDLKVRILSISTGVAKKDFKVDNGRFKLIASDYLAVFNSQAKKVQVNFFQFSIKIYNK